MTPHSGHIPKPILIFWVRFQLSRSGKNKVYLKNVDLNSAGRYRCEVREHVPKTSVLLSDQKERSPSLFRKSELRFPEVTLIFCTEKNNNCSNVFFPPFLCTLWTCLSFPLPRSVILLRTHAILHALLDLKKRKSLLGLNGSAVI